MARLGVNRDDLQAAWDRVVNSGFFTEGYYVKALEEAVSEWSGLNAIAVNSAGSGLYTMLRCKLGRRRQMAVPNNTFYATGAMAREAGHEVILVDCNRHDFSMSLESLLLKHGAFDAVILTHVGGGLATDLIRTAHLCQQRGIPLFEDAAHAFGVKRQGKTAGAFSEAAVFSLYPTKAIPAGEGGIIVTHNAAYAEEMREFRNYGKYWEGAVLKHRWSGFNFRMDEWTAAVAYLQMQRLDEILELREASAAKLRKVIAPLVTWPVGETNWYKYIVRRAEAEVLGLKRFSGRVYAKSDQLATALNIPKPHDTPSCDWVAANHVCLPLDEGQYLDMSQDQILAYLRGDNA